ncbi:MAG: hypothetical protein PVSMB7_02000 [Chloroflexota bacterium]
MCLGDTDEVARRTVNVKGIAVAVGVGALVAVGRGVDVAVAVAQPAGGHGGVIGGGVAPPPGGGGGGGPCSGAPVGVGVVEVCPLTVPTTKNQASASAGRRANNSFFT